MEERLLSDESKGSPDTRQLIGEGHLELQEEKRTTESGHFVRGRRRSWDEGRLKVLE